MTSLLNQRLLEACSSADLTKAAVLLDQGADPNSQDELGLSCLHRAAQISDESRPIAGLIDLLVKKGARIRHSALHCSCSLQAVRSLLAANAEVNARTTDGRTALMAAVSAGREEVALELLRSGASVDSSLLLKSNSVSVMRELLVRGADPNVLDSAGNSPLQLAVDRGDRTLARLLLEFKADASKATRRQTQTDPPSLAPEISVASPPPPQPTPQPQQQVQNGNGASGRAESQEGGPVPLSEFLEFMKDFERGLSPEAYSSIELGAIEGAMDVVLRKIRGLRQ